MDKEQINKTSKNDLFKSVVIILLVVIAAILFKAFIFTPEDARSAKIQKCLLTMKKVESAAEEYDSLIATPEYQDSTEDELDALNNEILENRDLSLENIQECWAFLEAENIDYSIRNEF